MYETLRNSGLLDGSLMCSPYCVCSVPFHRSARFYRIHSWVRGRDSVEQKKKISLHSIPPPPPPHHPPALSAAHGSMEYRRSALLSLSSYRGPGIPAANSRTNTHTHTYSVPRTSFPLRVLLYDAQTFRRLCTHITSSLVSAGTSHTYIQRAVRATQTHKKKKRKKLVYKNTTKGGSR